jgi:hypothetical protein
MSDPLVTLINSGGRVSTKNPPLCVQTPTQDNELANKKYVDNTIQNNKLIINEVRINNFRNIIQNVDVAPNSMTAVTNADNADSWSSLGGGVNGYVNALAIDSVGNIYVAGVFTIAGTVPCNNIAMWDGSNWSLLGTDTENGTNTVYSGSTPESVTSLAIDSNDNVYAAGYFTEAGGVSCNCIAMWNPNKKGWTTLVDSTTGTVCIIDVAYALAIDSNDNVYVGGVVDCVLGANICQMIAQWNPNTKVWSGLTTGTNNNVCALAIDSSDIVYVGGYFQLAGTVPCNNIAMWDGSNWLAFGSGTGDNVNAFVNALAIDSSDNVYVGGSFPIFGGVNCSNVAKWDGTAWSGLPTDPAFNNQVKSLAVDSNANVYIGGYFTAIGSTSCSSIAVWNQSGNNFSPLGTGTNSPVWALAIDNIDNVIVGGYFTNAGGVNGTVGLAEWGSTTSVVSVNNDSTISLPKKSSMLLFRTNTDSLYSMSIVKA